MLLAAVLVMPVLLWVTMQDRARFGLGAASNGIWNFAYGANMSPAKLGGSRGLRPLASQPGKLSGHRLAFNHRGGFGNVVSVDRPSAAAAEERLVTEAGTETIQAADTGKPAAAAPGPRAGDAVAEAVLHRPVDAVHGVLHKLRAEDMAMLMNMEHEYW
jgi:hypothetical protein